MADLKHQQGSTMHRREFLRLSGGVIALATGSALAGCSGDILGQGDDPGDDGETRLVLGQTQQVAGTSVSSWARIKADNSVAQVGVTLPLALAQNQPTQTGTGPAGAIAVLAFPAEVRSSTFFNHFELHTEPGGHPPDIYAAPHFDLHFYAIPVEQVRQITAPDPVPPAADRVPAGYTYPGAEATVPEMGVHALPNTDFAPGASFSASMIAGYYNGQMQFLEPMVTTERLRAQQSFTLPVPRPPVLGRAVRYPTSFTAIFNAAAGSYDLVFGDFISVT